MLIKQKHLDGIKSGVVTLAFRKWKKTSVTSGSLLMTAIGLIQIKSVTPYDLSAITEADALKAGYNNPEELFKVLGKANTGIVYRIELSYYSEDPRIHLSETTDLTQNELELLRIKLDKLDRYSKAGSWTMMILELIRKHPMVKAAELAAMSGYEKEWLKLNVRKLKNLGLTISHNTGYSISPLGQEFIEWNNNTNVVP